MAAKRHARSTKRATTSGKKRPQKRRTKRTTSAPKDHVKVTGTSYGKDLRGIKIYFEGKRPSFLKPDGTMNMGKHVLEHLTKKFPRFRWTITKDTDEIKTEYGITRVRTSLALIKRMHGEHWDRTKDIKNDIVKKHLAKNFPNEFTTTAASTYVPGTIANMIDANTLARLSSADKETLNNFLPDFIASESVGTVNKLKATTQITTLKELSKNLEEEITREHPESWWQEYIKSNILLIQQGYIKALNKLNISIGTMKFPDFTLVTHDNYLDILEIKKPTTTIIKLDNSRKNYYFDTEISKAISQTENYINNVNTHANDIRSYLKDHEHLDIKAIRPRGIILVGDTRTFTTQKEKDDYRLLSHGIKNINILTYDELLTRLQNYIEVLEEFSKTTPRGAGR